MPFNPCGRGVDFLDRAVTDLIRPFRDSDITVRRKWFPVPEGTPLLGFPSAFLSAHWEPYPWFSRKVGEVYPPDVTYPRSGVIGGFNYEHICGTEEDFQLGAVFDPTANVLYDSEWIPTCCGREDVCVTQVCSQYQVGERPAGQLVSYPVQHQVAAPTTPFHLFQVAANQGENDPAWPGTLTAFYPGGIVAPAGWSQEVVSDETGVMLFVENTFRIDGDNAITERFDATGWNLVVEQGGVSGSINLAIVGGVLQLTGVNFELADALLPATVCYSDTVNEFTEGQIIGPTVAATNTVQTVLTLQQESTGTVANGFGERILALLESASGVVRNAAEIRMLWRTAADATREGRMTLQTYAAGFAVNNVDMACIGGFPAVGFNGAAPQVKATPGGSTFGFTQNAGNAVFDASTFTGGIGASAYTIDDIVNALKLVGLLG